MAMDLNSTATDKLGTNENLGDTDANIFNTQLDQSNGFSQEVPSATDSNEVYSSEADTNNEKDVPVGVATGSLENFGR